MNISTQNHAGRAPWVAAAVLAFLFCGVVLCAVVGVTGYFRLSSETAALRSSFMRSVPGPWEKKIAVSVGGLTTGVVRLASRFFALPPEPRAALDTLHAADVGVYRLKRELVAQQLNTAAIIKAADRVMMSHGWDRAVGVADGGDLVAVYWPARETSAARARCCVLVFHGRELVVTSVRGNLEPLMELAKSHVRFEEIRSHIR